MLAALYALTVVGFPLVSTVPTLVGVDSQAATVPFRIIVAALAVGILYGWWVRGTRVLFNAAVICTLALWALLVSRMFFDTMVDPLPGDLGIPASQFLLLSLGACYLPALAGLESPDARTLDLARVWIEVLGAIAMLAILYVGLRGVFQGSVLYRLATPVLNPISVGHLGVSVLIVTLCGFAGSGPGARLLRSLLVLLSVIVVVGSVSRGPILAALVAALLLATRPRAGARIRLFGVVLRVALVAAAIAAVVAAINYLEETGIIDVVERLTETLQDVASQERTAMIVGAWQQFTEHPFVGSAFVERRFMMNPHNVILESLMAVGVVGLGLLLVSMSASLVATQRVLRIPGNHAWVGLIYVQYVINGMLSGSLFTDGTFWLFGLGVMALAARLQHPSDGLPA
jgi:O-antigen ligase